MGVSMRSADLICCRPIIRWNDQLFLALNILGGRGTPYRVVVVDEGNKVKGVINGRRILEVLLGRRGESLKTKEGLRGVLREPVNLFLDEARNIFPESVSLQTVLQYMAENNVGYVIIADENGVFKGCIDEEVILGRLLNKKFNVKVGDVMTQPALTVPPEATLFDAANMMIDSRVRRVFVVRGENMVGILTVTDILNHVLTMEKHLDVMIRNVDVEDIFRSRVEDVMNREVISVSSESDVGEAINKVVKNDISCLPVSTKSRVLGVVCRVDLVVGIVKLKGAAGVIEMMG